MLQRSTYNFSRTSIGRIRGTVALSNSTDFANFARRASFSGHHPASSQKSTCYRDVGAPRSAFAAAAAPAAAGGWSFANSVSSSGACRF